jgi:putative endonuclease
MLHWLKSKFSSNNQKSQKPKTLGQLGEEFAQEEYRRRGYKIIAANFFNPRGLRLGEIDFIAKDKTRIIFVEVKTRTIGDIKFGSAGEAVNTFKQIKLLKSAKIFLLKNQQYQSLTPQIDVCAVEFSPVDPVRNRPAEGTATAARGRLVSNGVDKNFRIAKILSNAVEDWN